MAPTEVAPGVHRLGTEFVNWYVLEAADGIVAIDAGLPGYARTLERDLRALGRSLDDVRAVVLTHGDADHTGVVGSLTSRGAPVHLHRDDAELVAKPRPKKTEASLLRYVVRHRAPQRFLWHAIRTGSVRPTTITDFQPLEDGAEIAGTGLRAIHTPGHTHGHCVIHHAGRGVLFAGDELCTRNPLTGREGMQIPARGANIDTAAVLGSLDRVEPLAAHVVLCGHGNPFNASPADAAAMARSAEPS
jgi:glyoxylase-like metal-dependent hydrolase (beta-lactamase superfamily II)